MSQQKVEILMNLLISSRDSIDSTRVNVVFSAADAVVVVVIASASYSLINGCGWSDSAKLIVLKVVKGYILLFVKGSDGAWG